MEKKRINEIQLIDISWWIHDGRLLIKLSFNNIKNIPKVINIPQSIMIAEFVLDKTCSYITHVVWELHFFLLYL